MLVAAFATFAVLTLSYTPVPPTPSGGTRGPSTPRPAVAAPSARARGARPAAGTTLPLSAADLYSARAKRRMASFLRMRLLELRLRGLARAAEVIEQRLPVDALLRAP
jgi:hypothetical protein